MQGCRRSWEDKLKCVKILIVKDHNSAKICQTWILSPHALLDLWCNIPAKFHSNPCKDVGGVENTNFDGTEWRNDGRTEWRKDGMTEWRNDGMTDKANTKCPLPFYGGGIKIINEGIRLKFVLLNKLFKIFQNYPCDLWYIGIRLVMSSCGCITLHFLRSNKVAYQHTSQPNS